MLSSFCLIVAFIEHDEHDFQRTLLQIHKDGEQQTKCACAHLKYGHVVNWKMARCILVQSAEEFMGTIFILWSRVTTKILNIIKLFKENIFTKIKIPHVFYANQ